MISSYPLRVSMALGNGVVCRLTRYTEIRLSFPQFTPADLIRRAEPFDHEDYIFELKMDGFRALAYVDHDGTRLVSRGAKVYRSFSGLCAAIRANLGCEAVIDGEIVILDADGHPQFYDLLRRRGGGESVFYVFDLLWLNGQDLRDRPLLDERPYFAPSFLTGHRCYCTPTTLNKTARSFPPYVRAGLARNRGQAEAWPLWRKLV